MSDDIFAKLQGLLGDNDLVEKVQGLAGGAGGFNPAALIAGLQANPALLGQLTEKLGPNPLATLQGLIPGGEGGPDLGALGGLGDALGGLMGKKD